MSKSTTQDKKNLDKNSVLYKGCGYYIRCNGVSCGLQVYTHPVKNKYKAIEVWNRRMR